jgi:hypothetical protein
MLELAVIQELNSLKKLASKYAWCGQEERNYLESEGGISIRKPHFYSSIPTISDIESSFEYDSLGNSLPVFMPELYDLASMAESLASINKHLPNDLSTFCSDTGFEWANGQFDRTDAVHYYGFIREYNPNTILEIGSGWSTRIAASAASFAGSKVICIDPEPRANLSGLNVEFRKSRIESFDPLDIASLLSPGDILFIDSSHALKTGNDCVFIYCLLFPILPRGLIIHIHDLLYLPFSRPRSHLIKERLYWYEDYLVHLLISAGRLRPIIANNYLQRSAKKSMLLATPNGVGGASMWFEVL